MPRRYTVALAALVSLALVAWGALRWGPAVAVSLGLALPGVERWLSWPAASPVPEAIAIPARGRTLAADLYRPARVRGALLLVHGLSPAGRRHHELESLARLLARAGRLVLVPQFDGLAALRLDGGEVEDVRAALAHLAGLHPGVGIAGFSFGAGPALIAAAADPRVRVAGSFGGYADLRNVVAFLTTGVHGHGDRRWVQAPQDYNRWKLLSLLAGLVVDPRQRAGLDAIARARLADPSQDTRALESDLAGEAAAVMALVTNRRADAVVSLLAALSPRTHAALEALSPLAAARRLSGRLLIAHGVYDDSIPFSEAFRLGEAAGEGAQLVLLRTFHHTGPGARWRTVRDTALDGWRVFRLVDALLVPGG